MSDMTLTEVARAASMNSEAHEFHEDHPSRQGNPPDIGYMRLHIASKLALIHSEVSEALEEVRDNGHPLRIYRRDDDKPEGLAAELADVVIRVGDLAHSYGIDLGIAVEEKMRFNESRPHKHGKAF